MNSLTSHIFKLKPAANACITHSCLLKYLKFLKLSFFFFEKSCRFAGWPPPFYLFFLRAMSSSRPTNLVLLRRDILKMLSYESNYDRIIPKLILTIRATSSLAARDVKFHASLDPKLTVELENTSMSLLLLANSMMVDISSSFKPLDHGEIGMRSAATWRTVSDTLDSCFEKVDIALDMKKISAKGTDTMIQLFESAEVDVPEVKEKPQLHFRTKEDNSDSHPFKPRLSLKPHALKPLEECINYTNESDDQSHPHYSHPYEYEIMNQPFPDSQLVPHDPVNFIDWNASEPTWIDNVESLHQMVEELSQLTEIAVDLEHHDYRSYYGITCLMQISNRQKDWLIDTLSLRDDLQVLNELFANPAIVKVFHGASMDIHWLQRDLGLYVVSLFDTYHASKKLGFPKFSLAYLLETIAHFKTSKKYQLADWRIRPLTALMIQYARADTHFLLFIYDVLRNKLIEKGVLQDVLFESRRVACRRFEYTTFRKDLNEWPSGQYGLTSLKRMILQYNLTMSKQGLLDSLLTWRDRLARAADESPRYILSNRALINLCNLSHPIDSRKITAAVGKLSNEIMPELPSLIAILQKDLFDVGLISGDSKIIVPSKEKVSFATACKVDEKFNDLVRLSKDEKSKLIEKSSSYFAPIHSQEDSNFSIKFNSPTKDNVVSRVEFESRKEHMKNAFLPLVLESKKNITKESSIDESDPKSDTPKSDEIETGSIEEPPEIFTLSTKKNRNNQRRFTELSSGPIFDYNAPENTKVLGSFTANQRSKKRSFDPFSKAGSGGPRAAKRTKSLAVGKSGSFKSKKHS